ncbi:MAG: ABC transporter ATP-binding protein [Bacteroidota bacterium]|nr:ABC transporter ATP-binding protein [Bacteroidota bacterium]
MTLMNYLKEVSTIFRHNSNREKYNIYLLKYLAPHIRKQKSTIFFCIFLLFLLSIISLPIPYLIKVIIDDILPLKKYDDFYTIILIIFSLYLLKTLLSFILGYIFSLLNNNIQVTIQKSFFNKIIHLPFSFINRMQTGYLLARMKEINILSIFFSRPVLGIVIDLIEFIIIIAILLYLSWQLTLLAGLIIPVYYLIVKKISPSLLYSTRNLLEQNALFSKNVQESLSGISIIKSFGAEKRATLKIEKNLFGLLKTGIVQNIFLTISSELIFLVSSIGSLIVLWYSGINIMEETFTIGLYVAIASYVAKLYAPIQKFASIGITLQPAFAALSRVSDFLKFIAEDESPNRNISVKNLKDKIEFHSVSFRYENSNFSLKDINLIIYPNSKIAIIGPNGSGKTTLISLLTQFYEPTSGKIFFGGYDAKEIKLSSLREKIGIIPQDVFLFDDTIKNNIKFGNPESDDKLIIAAAQKAGAHDFIINQIDGYNTIVGERGIKLSAGQKQKISIARTLLYNPDLLIFDEPIAFLDSLGYTNFQTFLKNNINDKTVIICTHHESIIRLSEWVVLLEDGKIKKQGIPSLFLDQNNFSVIK